MKTSELIAALQAADPSGMGDVFVYHSDTDEDYILTGVSGNNDGNAGDVLLNVGIACRLCKHESADEDDSWDGFCPSCADKVSEWIDAHPGKDQDDAVEALSP